jgi:hypothetical protein
MDEVATKPGMANSRYRKPVSNKKIHVLSDDHKMRDITGRQLL